MPDDADPSPAPAERKDDPATAGDSTPTIRSEELFAGSRVVRIQHGEEQYRLMITRNNRLILQK